MGELTSTAAELARELNDPAKWVIKRGVPVFSGHDRKLPDGKLKYKVTDDDLVDAVENLRSRQNRGMPARLTVGHINPDPNFPEEKQPKVIGYWLDAKMGEFDGKPAAFADAYVRIEHKDAVKGRPYRSAEYIRGRNEIRGVALLARDPALDLGTVEVCQDGDEEVEFYSMTGAVDMSQDTTELYAKVTAENDTLKAEMVSLKAALALANADGQTEQTELYAKISGEVETLRIQNAEFAKKIAESEAKADRLECEKLVEVLVSERYQLDREEEVTELLALQPADRVKRIAKIRKRYHQDQTGAPFIETYSAPVEGDLPAINADVAQKAVSYATTNKCDFDTALKAVRAGK